MSALNGNLQDFGIAEVFQLIGQQCKTGMLEITHEARTIQLHFDKGAVVWGSPAGATEHSELGDRMVRCGLLTRERLRELSIECQASARSLPALAIALDVVARSDIEEIRELLTRDTIFEVLRWTQGSFRFTSQAVQHDRPEHKLLGAEQILMDGLRMVDEWQTFCDLVPSGDTVFQRLGPIESFRQQAKGDARHRVSQAERVLEFVDGRLSAQRVIDLSRLGIFDATRILSELRSAGCIEPLASSARSRSRLKARRGAAALGSTSTWVSSAVAVGLLVAAVGLIFLSHPDAGVGVSIQHSPLAAARAEFEKRRLRHLLEAERLLSGEWPADLAEVGRSGLASGAALTSARSAAYYYARRSDGIVLLAPEQ